MERRVGVLTYLVVTMSISSWALKEHCDPGDKKALLGIKNSFSPSFPSWTPETDCCRDWYGVKCSGPFIHRVNRIYLSDVLGIRDNLTGIIPEEVGDLTELLSITIRKNTNVTGTIPASIVKLKKLGSIDFSWNKLSGPIPTFFRYMPTLSFLDLSFNQFSGSIPPQLALGPAITGLDFSRNMLTGPIPPGLASFQNSPIRLFLSHNRLSGELPASLGKVAFDTIDLSRNNLTGDVSYVFSSGADSVDLSRNSFSFNMSNFNLSLVGRLDISHNRVFGSLPAVRVKQYPSYYGLNVSYNRLCGQIPAYAARFDVTSYLHNKCLCGSPLPACH